MQKKMEPKVICESDLPEIVDILYEDVELVENRERFALALGLTGSELTDVRRVVHLEILSTRGFFSMVLELWIKECSFESTFDNLVTILQKLGHYWIADKIRKHSDPISNQKIENESSTVLSLCFEVPRQFGANSTSFIARTKDMELLSDSLITSSNVRESERRAMTIVTGNAGVGKTSLVTHYCWKFFQMLYSTIIWINAEPEQISDSFARLAKHIGEETSDSSDLSKIYTKLQKNNTLLVFDNVESFEGVKDYLPPNNPRMHVILVSTSSAYEWPSVDTKIPVGVFNQFECINMFKKILNLESPEQLALAVEIGTALGNHPVAIKVAAFYISFLQDENTLKIAASQVALGLKSMVETLTPSLKCKVDDVAPSLKSYLELCNKIKKPNEKEMSVTDSCVYTSLKISLELLKIRNSLAVRILELISYFGPNQFPITILYNIKAKFGLARVTAASSNISESDLYTSLKLLSNLGIVKKEKSHFGNSVTTPKIIQKLVRDFEVNIGRKSRVLKEAISLIRISIGEMSGWSPYKQICVEHAMYLFRHIQETKKLNYADYMAFLGFVSKEGGEVFKRLVTNSE